MPVRRRRTRKKMSVNDKINAALARRAIRKKLFIQIPSRNANAGAEPFSISDISQGVAIDERVGDIVKLLKLHIIYETIIGDTTNLVRVIVIMWKQDDIDCVPQLVDIFEDPLVERPLNEFDFQNKPNEFAVLYDKIHVMNAGSGQSRIGFINLGVKQLPGNTTYENLTGSQGTNKLYLLAFSDSSATPHPTFKAQGRLEFTNATK